MTATSTIPAVKGTETRTIITTKNNDKYDLRDNFELHAIIVFHGTGKLYWTGRLRTVISVSKCKPRREKNLVYEGEQTAKTLLSLLCRMKAFVF